MATLRLLYVTPQMSECVVDIIFQLDVTLII